MGKLTMIQCRKSILLKPKKHIPNDPESKLMLAIFGEPAGKNAISVKDVKATNWFANFCSIFQ